MSSLHSSPERQPENADEAFAVFREEFLADAGLAVEAVERCFGGEADQVAIAFFIFGEDEQVVVVSSACRRDGRRLLADVELRSRGSA